MRPARITKGDIDHDDEKDARILLHAAGSLRSPEAIQNLKLIINNEEYARANRTGCALLYLAQVSERDKEKYLKAAIEKHSDCWYGDGVQVGAYARFHLAFHYHRLGKQEQAEALFEEIRRRYPDAVDHRGRRLADSIPSE